MMKKFLTSAIAIGSAITMAFIPAAQVFAFDEVTPEQQFVNSFSDETTREVADYYLNAGLSLEETADIMKTYKEGLAEIAATPATLSDTTDFLYYNKNSLCDTNHYAVAIITNATEDVSEAFSVIFNNSTVSCVKSDIHSCFPYTKEECDIGVHNTIKQSGDNTTIKTTVGANAPGNARLAEGIVRYKFEIIDKNSITSESEFRNAIEFKPDHSDAVEIETYALGDVDHNGIVDAADQTYLSQFLVGKLTSFGFTYKDGSNHFSFVTNGLAADTNQDDVVDALDAVQLNRYIAGKSSTLVD